ncbi:MAG TPA: DUF2589 domain-containing protein [Candidatus Deferrimicrobium sp.]|nr:DUF2589 domain-containing protein [Candidatus Deferrimicrobium sp.]
MPTPGQELSSIDFESMIGGPLVAVINAQAQAAMSTSNFVKTVGFKAIASEQDPDSAEVGDPIYVKFRYPKEISAYQPKVGAGDGSLNFSLDSPGSGYDPAAIPTVTIPAPPAGGTPPTITLSVNADGTVSIAIPNRGSGYNIPPKITVSRPPAGGSPAVISATVDTPEVPAVIQPMFLEVPILTILPIPFLRIDLATIDFNAKINSIEYRKTDTSFQIKAGLEAKAGWLFGSAKLKVSTSYKRSTQTGVNVERTYSMAVHVQASQDEMPAGMERILGILEGAIIGQPQSAPPPRIA